MNREDTKCKSNPQGFYASGRHIGLAVHDADDTARIRGAVRTESQVLVINTCVYVLDKNIHLPAPKKVRAKGTQNDRKQEKESITFSSGYIYSVGILWSEPCVCDA